MQVSSSLWQKTHVGVAFQPFPGFMSSQLKHADAAMLVRADMYISHIFWRWYHLVHAHVDHDTPAQFAKKISLSERWPMGGIFTPSVTLQISQDPTIRVQTRVSIDYTDLVGTHLWRDAHTPRRRRVTFDEPYYIELLSLLSRHTPVQDDISPSTLYSRWVTHYIHTVLLNARQKISSGLVRTVFTTHTWIRVWYEKLLLPATKLRGVSYDDFLDHFIHIVRRTHPHFGITCAEGHHYGENLTYEMFLMAEEYYTMCREFTQYILIPLSLYIPLIDPVYTDAHLFCEDVKITLTTPTQGEELFAPPSHVIATMLGDQFIDV